MCSGARTRGKAPDVVDGQVQPTHQARERSHGDEDAVEAADPEEEVPPALDHETFANTLCQILGLPAEEKQGLLEAPGARARLDALEGLLHFHLVKQRMPAGSGSEVLH